MILPSTAVANGGLCAPCAKLSPESRRAIREHRDKLASGAWFRPSTEELASAQMPAEVVPGAAVWSPEPDFYKDRSPSSVRELLADATARPEGDVYLVCASGARLNLTLNDRYGVCEYWDPEGGTRYAYTPENLSEQVQAEFHLVQGCPCCGVGLARFPSRFHMPRSVAFALVSAVVLGDPDGLPEGLEWLDGGDITFTERGRG
jgi:hypothetical protein